MALGTSKCMGWEVGRITKLNVKIGKKDSLLKT